MRTLAELHADGDLCLALFRQNVFSYDRMCSLTIECVLLHWQNFMLAVIFVWHYFDIEHASDRPKYLHYTHTLSHTHSLSRARASISFPLSLSLNPKP